MTSGNRSSLSRDWFAPMGKRASLLVAGALVLVAGLQCCTPQVPELVEWEILPTDHVLAVGDPQVTVIEYSEFQCPFCGQFARNALPTLRKDYIETGKVRWIFRHFPLRSIHTHAQAAAEASECAADQGKFWEYHDLLFQHQSDLTKADLKSYAGQLGLDQETFDACLDSGAKAARVQIDVDSGQASGIPGTPTFLINGKVSAGNQSASSFAKLLDAALTEVGG